MSAPIASGLSVPIGVDAPAGAASYPVNATTPTTVSIFVDSLTDTSGLGTFDPVTDINPATIVVNGVAFPNATIAADPVDENGDGIEDAIITITPRSALNFQNGTSTLTLTGTTLASAQQPNTRFVGTTTIVVSGGTNNGGGGLPGVVTVSPSFGFAVNNPAGSNIGERLIPQVQTLSQLQYKPLTYAKAFHQFLPSQAYRDRHEQIYNKHVKGRKVATTANSSKGTLAPGVFTRGQFPRNKPIPPIHHHVKLTIPRTLY